MESIILEILRMNVDGGEFRYCPSVSYYFDREPIISCFVKHESGVAETVLDYKGDIMQKIHDATERMRRR